jgi:hypothetical protein
MKTNMISTVSICNQFVFLPSGEDKSDEWAHDSVRWDLHLSERRLKGVEGHFCPYEHTVAQE